MWVVSGTSGTKGFVAALQTSPPPPLYAPSPPTPKSVKSSMQMESIQLEFLLCCLPFF